MQPSLIHLEHALPALAELGIEHLVPLLGGRGLNVEVVGAALKGLASGAEARAARLLVAVAKATGPELLAWESDADLKARALKDAALATFEEAQESVGAFFASLGLSPLAIPVSSETGTEAPVMATDPPTPTP